MDPLYLLLRQEMEGLGLLHTLNVRGPYSLYLRLFEVQETPRVLLPCLSQELGVGRGEGNEGWRRDVVFSGGHTDTSVGSTVHNLEVGVDVHWRGRLKVPDPFSRLVRDLPSLEPRLTRLLRI